jgi:4-hydroxybenzoate polyprenyltransferase
MTTAVVRLPRLFARLVKLEHTVFALPFAYTGAFLARLAVPTGHDLAWITVAMVGARTLAMGLNRLIDSEIDARNPRTAGRELPSGALTRQQVIALCAGALALFLAAVFELDPVVRWLWPIPVCLFVLYPYLKRVTWLCHLWLGVSLGLAPVGAWLAVQGSAPWEAWVLAGGVCLWVAGFDMFYALYDLEHDLDHGLRSWATRWGTTGVFAGARVFHLGTVGMLALVGTGLAVGVWYWLGVAAVGALLLYEHLLVRPTDLRRLDAAFFTVNGLISFVFFAFVVIECV